MNLATLLDTVNITTNTKEENDDIEDNNDADDDNDAENDEDDDGDDDADGADNDDDAENDDADDDDAENDDADDDNDNDDVEDDDNDDDDDGDDDDDDDDDDKVNIKQNDKENKKSSSSFMVFESEDDESEDDDGEAVDMEYSEFQEKEVKKYINEFYPEMKQCLLEEVHSKLYIKRNKDYVIEDSNHTTIPILTKYEKARILGIRASQLNDGADPYIKVSSNVVDSYVIAQKELKEKVLPFIISRPLPNGNIEYWRLRDLEILQE